MEWQPDQKSPANSVARLHLRLPDGFPERYQASILKAIDLCAVKKQMLEPPTFETLVESPPL
jgi:ribosomal protein S12 methylthiotransferase accessory factor